jgi:hypothetical protein
MFLESENEPDVEIVQQKLKKRFQSYYGISKNFEYLNFRIFNLYVKSSDKVEQVCMIRTLHCSSRLFSVSQVCKVEFSTKDALGDAVRLQTAENSPFKVQKLEKAVLDEINRDVGNADVDYYIAGLCLHSPF